MIWPMTMRRFSVLGLKLALHNGQRAARGDYCHVNWSSRRVKLAHDERTLRDAGHPVRRRRKHFLQMSLIEV